jgi:hypothetical protein
MGSGYIDPDFLDHGSNRRVVSFGPGRFISGEGALGNHQIGDWMGSRAGIDDLEKRKFLSLPRIEVRIEVIICPPFKEIRKVFIEIISTITITINEHNQMV